MSRLENAKADMTNPRTIPGTDQRRMRLLPMRSMRVNATRVKRRFVEAISMDVAVGLVKPIIAKIVAEKYMSEFCVSELARRIVKASSGDLQTHKTAAKLATYTPPAMPFSLAYPSINP